MVAPTTMPPWGSLYSSMFSNNSENKSNQIANNISQPPLINDTTDQPPFSDLNSQPANFTDSNTLFNPKFSSNLVAQCHSDGSLENSNTSNNPIHNETNNGNCNTSPRGNINNNPSTGESGDASDDSNPFLNYQQGQMPDCGVLSTISAIASTPKGKNLLNSSIKTDGNGGYEVTLKGTGEKYDVTQGQLKDPNLSHGSPKVAALEVALKQHFGDSDNTFKHLAREVVPVLTGQQTNDTNLCTSSEAKSRLLSLAPCVDNQSTALEVTANDLPDSPTPGFHGYSVTNINPSNDTVTYENPWKANVSTTVNLNQFSQDMATGGDGCINAANL